MKKLNLLWLVPSTLLLTGCLGELIEFSCMMSDDEDHCYQAAVVQDSDPEDCSKVAGAGFTGSNPPKDKCFLQIAENTGDPSVCEGIEGGFMSYSQEECLDAVFRNHTVDACAQAQDEMKCRAGYAKRFGECGGDYVFNQAAGVCEKPKPVINGADDDIESKVEGDLNTIKDAATGKYMELLEGAIENETDPSKLAGLQAYKEFLEKSGETIDTVNTTVDQLKELKRLFLDAYDPSMDIERMPVDKLLAPGLFDKISNRIFGEDPPTERSKADDALTVYEAMLKRQGEIDFLKKDMLSRITETVVFKAKDQATDKLKETVTGIVEGAAGTAFATVGIVGDALDSFKEEAQKEMFIGLAAAYNRQRDAIVQSNPGLSAEEIHRRTVSSVQQDPYADSPNLGFVKYGNLLENKDCQDEGNPLCIDNRVWWVAMDKAYQATHK